MIEFSKNFLWGASTSAHQVEGGLHNDWTEWEELNADKLATKAQSRYFPNPKHKQEAIKPENYISNLGKVNHWQNYREDLRLLKEMGMNAYRFSIEWARLEPRPGEFDLSAANHYLSMIDYMHELGITPVMTLWHFSSPTWFRDLGGWEDKHNLKYFVRFTQFAVKTFGEVVDYWVTINEPQIYSSMAYSYGAWPPAKRHIFTPWKVLFNLAKAHKRAYIIIKQAKPASSVSVAHNLCYYEPLRPTLWNKLHVKWATWVHNYLFLDQVRHHLDFIGVNYYFHEVVSGLRKFANQPNRSDLNWGLSPAGIVPLLIQTHQRYRLPILITENGLADSENQYRPWYLSEIKLELAKLLDQNFPLLGYLHWSLLDNFEWADGWWPRFGLIAVDPSTGKRIPRLNQV